MVPAVSTDGAWLSWPGVVLGRRVVVAVAMSYSHTLQAVAVHCDRDVAVHLARSRGWIARRPCRPVGQHDQLLGEPVEQDDLPAMGRSPQPSEQDPRARGGRAVLPGRGVDPGRRASLDVFRVQVRVRRAANGTT